MAVAEMSRPLVSTRQMRPRARHDGAVGEAGTRLGWRPRRRTVEGMPFNIAADRGRRAKIDRLPAGDSLADGRGRDVKAAWFRPGKCARGPGMMARSAKRALAWAGAPATGR